MAGFGWVGRKTSLGICLDLIKIHAQCVNSGAKTTTSFDSKMLTNKHSHFLNSALDCLKLQTCCKARFLT